MSKEKFLTYQSESSLNSIRYFDLNRSYSDYDRRIRQSCKFYEGGVIYSVDLPRKGSSLLWLDDPENDSEWPEESDSAMLLKQHYRHKSEAQILAVRKINLSKCTTVLLDSDFKITSLDKEGNVLEQVSLNIPDEEKKELTQGLPKADFPPIACTKDSLTYKGKTFTAGGTFLHNDAEKDHANFDCRMISVDTKTNELKIRPTPTERKCLYLESYEPLMLGFITDELLVMRLRYRFEKPEEGEDEVKEICYGREFWTLIDSTGTQRDMPRDLKKVLEREYIDQIENMWSSKTEEGGYQMVLQSYDFVSVVQFDLTGDVAGVHIFHLSMDQHFSSRTTKVIAQSGEVFTVSNKKPDDAEEAKESQPEKQESEAEQKKT